MTTSHDQSIIDAVRVHRLSNTGDNYITWYPAFVGLLRSKGFTVAADLIESKVLPRNHPQAPNNIWQIHLKLVKDGTPTTTTMDHLEPLEPQSGWIDNYRGTMYPEEQLEGIGTGDDDSIGSAGKTTKARRSGGKSAAAMGVQVAGGPYGWYPGDPLIYPRTKVEGSQINSMDKVEVGIVRELKTVTAIVKAAVDDTLKTRLEQNDLYRQASMKGRPDVMMEVIKMTISSNRPGTMTKCMANVSIALDYASLLELRYKEPTNILLYLDQFKRLIKKLEDQGFDPDNSDQQKYMYGIYLILSVRHAFPDEYERAARNEQLKAPNCTLLWAEETIKAWDSHKKGREAELERATAMTRRLEATARPATVQVSQKNGKKEYRPTTPRNGKANRGNGPSGGNGNGKKHCKFCNSSEHWTTQCNAPGMTPQFQAILKAQHREFCDNRK